MSNTQSIADLLRQSVENATDPEPLEIQLPIFNPPLYLSLRKVKDAKLREEVMTGVERISDEADRVLDGGARLLALACDDVFVMQGAQRLSLPKFGLPLWEFIHGETTAADMHPQTDVQAAFALYTGPDGECDTVALLDAVAKYQEYSTNVVLTNHEVVLGESQPGDTRPAT
jgi:hypothetical protein